jgi:PRTRC genetic system ThiF family protein
MAKVHFTSSYLLDPPHQITVTIAGVGGTGSQVLTALARINEGLKAKGHPGLHVKVYDDDEVSEANVGRQLFSTSDIGMNKAIVLTSRVNRFFGFGWEAHNKKFDPMVDYNTTNIIITCVDSAAARIDISAGLMHCIKMKLHPTEYPLYWLDFGNLKETGQVVLGTIGKIQQPSSKHETLPKLKTMVQMFPSLKKIKEEDQGPSCSLAQALNRQDLFINSTLANLGCNLLWKLLTEYKIEYQGLYLNLRTLTSNPIKL